MCNDMREYLYERYNLCVRNTTNITIETTCVDIMTLTCCYVPAACPENTYKELAGDHECDFCPPGYVTSTDASNERDDCYCMTSSSCIGT